MSSSLAASGSCRTGSLKKYKVKEKSSTENIKNISLTVRLGIRNAAKSITKVSSSALSITVRPYMVSRNFQTPKFRLALGWLFSFARSICSTLLI